MRTGDLIIALNRAHQAADAYWQHSRLTPRQFALLSAIADLADGEKKESINQIRITMATGMDRSTLAEVLLRLEQRKLITRRRDKNDRRSLIVNITAEGRAQLAEAIPAVAEVERWVMSCIHAKNLPGFIAGVHSLAKAHAAQR